MSDDTHMAELEGAEGRPTFGPSYSNIIRAVYETPWALHPAMLSTMLDVLRDRSFGLRLSGTELEERIEPRRTELETRRAGASRAATGSLAVLPLYGVIVPRATMMTELSGGAVLTRFAADFRALVNDPDVGGILLDIDSPGGSADLVAEVADEIRAARGTKPIVAIANTGAASAAYWIATAADELVVTPSGMVGSIGVWAAHENLSERMKMEGVEVSLVSAGKYKVEGNPYEPLGEEARGAIQSMVDEFYSMFVSAVAKGRNVAVSTVRDGFGEGRMVTAREAVKLGMADRVATFEDTVARMQGRRTSSGSRATALAAIETTDPVLELDLVSWTPALRGELGTFGREELEAGLDAMFDEVEANEEVDGHPPEDDGQTPEAIEETPDVSHLLRNDAFRAAFGEHNERTEA